MNSAKSETASFPRRATVPDIPQVPDGIHRPFFSVMIPTYNCASLLRVTLESVLSQAPGPEEMQIEVVDDASTKDDPESVVRECGKGRVSFYRQPNNVGATSNFNTCLERSQGHWVHILHGDDFILPGFYKAIQQAITQFPLAGLIATRLFIVDEAGSIERLTERVKSMEIFQEQDLHYTLSGPLYFAGTVFARDFVVNNGGFDTSLVHCADWEMWARIIHRQGGLFINTPLACYRMFSGNDTSRLAKTADNMRDFLRLSQVFSSEITGFNKETFRRQFIDAAFGQAVQFHMRGDLEAAAANLKLWKEFTPLSRRIRYHFGLWRRRIKRLR